MLEGAFALAETPWITPDDLPTYLQNAAGVTPDDSAHPVTYQEQLADFERKLLLETLAASRTKTEAAQKLGMTKQALNYKLTSLGLK